MGLKLDSQLSPFLVKSWFRLLNLRFNCDSEDAFKNKMRLEHKPLHLIQAKQAQKEDPPSPGPFPRACLCALLEEALAPSQDSHDIIYTNLPSSLSASFISSLDCGSFIKAAVLNLS